MTPGRLILVAGPRWSGVDGVVAGLAAALPGHVVVGAGANVPDAAPDVVVAVVSAVAPMTGTDWALVVRAAAGAEVIGAVSKIDAHRRWRAVLAADRSLAAEWDAGREPIRWVGVAAAPDLGEPRLDELVQVLRDRLADPGLNRRNNLRRSLVRTERNEVTRPSALQALELRSALQHARLRLLRLVRDRSAAMRAELREGAATVRRGDAGRFETVVRAAADDFLTGVDAEIAHAVAGLAIAPHPADGTSPPTRHEPPELSRPPAHRRLEGRLMAVLGVGFGLGIALAASRVVAGLAGVPSLVALAAGAVVGLALVAWVVRARALLAERALLDRWVTEVTAALRWHGEAVVAERLLVVETDRLRERAASRAPGRQARHRGGVNAGSESFL